MWIEGRGRQRYRRTPRTWPRRSTRASCSSRSRAPWTPSGSGSRSPTTSPTCAWSAPTSTTGSTGGCSSPSTRRSTSSRRERRTCAPSCSRGEGPSFCAGLDFKSFADGNGDLAGDGFEPPSTAQRANFAQRVAYGWRELEVPVIAALRGACLGGGPADRARRRHPDRRRRHAALGDGDRPRPDPRHEPHARRSPAWSATTSPASSSYTGADGRGGRGARARARDADRRRPAGRGAARSPPRSRRARPDAVRDARSGSLNEAPNALEPAEGWRSRPSCRRELLGATPALDAAAGRDAGRAGDSTAVRVAEFTVRGDRATHGRHGVRDASERRSLVQLRALGSRTSRGGARAAVSCSALPAACIALDPALAPHALEHAAVLACGPVPCCSHRSGRAPLRASSPSVAGPIDVTVAGVAHRAPTPGSCPTETGLPSAA